VEAGASDLKATSPCQKLCGVIGGTYRYVRLSFYECCDRGKWPRDDELSTIWGDKGKFNERSTMRVLSGKVPKGMSEYTASEGAD
jgi:hypothetical protein